MADEAVSGLELQYLSAERNLLQELSTVYGELAAASDEDLARLGSRIIDLHERLAGVGTAQQAVVSGRSYTAEVVRDIQESLGTGVVPPVEEQMLEEERAVLQQAAETEQELSTRSLAGGGADDEE